MKRLTLALLVTLIAIPVGISLSAEEKTEETAVKQTPAEKSEFVLKETFTDPKTKKKYEWVGNFTVDDSSAAKLKAKLKKRITYRITGALYEVKMLGSREVKSRQSGTCWIYIEDADGKEVARATKSLNVMCPSWGGRGGYFGEVAKEGKYTAVIWTKKNGVNIGAKYELDIKF